MGLSCFKSWKHDSTGHKGNRDVLASPGSYFFLSNSAGQGDEWLKSLNKGVWIPFTGVFGQRLEETVLYERRYGVRSVPLVVEQCVAFIRERGLHEVGLFRQPGQASLVKELQEAFDAGERPSFDSGTDVHTVASLLKLYLRQLPEPLVPFKRYQEFLLCAKRLSSDRTMGLAELRNLLHELPVANFNLLNFICQFLNEVQSYSSSNKMSGRNLATVFGPNILRAKAEDPQSIVGGAALVQVLMLELIREHESLFAKLPPSVFARPPRGPRASPSPLRQPHLHPTPCLRQLSLPLIAERSREPGQSTADHHNSSVSSVATAKSDLSSGQKRRLGHRYTSSHPENCFYPLPTSSQPLQNHQDRHNVDYHQDHTGQGPSLANEQASSSTSFQLQDLLSESFKPRARLMGWVSPWPDPDEACASFWTSEAGEERALAEAISGDSSDAQEDSTISIYDNLHRASQSQVLEVVPEAMKSKKVEKSRESSVSWSSCEVFPLDEGVTAADGVSSGVFTKKPSIQAEDEEKDNKDDHEEDNDSDEEEEEEEDEGDDHNEDVDHPNSPASGSVLSNSPLSTGSSEVFLPSGPQEVQRPEAQSQLGDAHELLNQLRQQMDQQKTEYQARIQRLERCNDVLERQVTILRVSLEQQKRSQSVAEIKIRNMEQAKADADLRNTTLQREMEMFFQMYGEFRRRGGEEAGRGAGGSI